MPELAIPQRAPAGARERQRRAEALRRHRSEERARKTGASGELAYLSAQLRLAARLSARLTETNDIQEMGQLLVQELHGTFAFYLAAIQRLDADGTLRLTAASGALAEVMTEFLLVEQSVNDGVNGCVARSGTSALVPDTLEDPDYILRDRATDPRSELSVPIMVDGSVWGVLNIEAPEPTAFTDTDVVLVEAIAASLGSSVHRGLARRRPRADLHDDPDRTDEHGRGERMTTPPPTSSTWRSWPPAWRCDSACPLACKRRPLRGAPARRRQGRHPERDPH